MDQAHEPVRPGRERAGRDRRAGRCSGRAENSGRAALGHGGQAEQGVQLVDAAAAEGRHLGKRVELAAPVRGGDRRTARQVQPPGRESPRRCAAVLEQLADELVQRDSAGALARARTDALVEGRTIARVEHLHVSVAGSRPRRRRRDERDGRDREQADPNPCPHDATSP
jgi:hypothetical protein